MFNANTPPKPKASKSVAKIVASAIVSLAIATPTANAGLFDLPGIPERKILEKSPFKHDRDLAGSLEKLEDDPIGYTVDRTREVIQDSCAFPARAFVKMVQHGGSGLKPLPTWFVQKAQPFYDVDLRRVRYSEGASVHGPAIAVTDKYNIYFENHLSFNNSNDLALMLHELEHVVQYDRKGGRSGMLCEYFLKAHGNAFQHGSIDMERSADNKANHVLRNWNTPTRRSYRSTRANAPIAPKSNYRRRAPMRPYRQPPPMQYSRVCRSGPYSQLVSPGPIGSPCAVTTMTPRGPYTFPGSRTYR